MQFHGLCSSVLSHSDCELVLLIIRNANTNTSDHILTAKLHIDMVWRCLVWEIKNFVIKDSKDVQHGSSSSDWNATNIWGSPESQCGCNCSSSSGCPQFSIYTTSNIFLFVKTSSNYLQICLFEIVPQMMIMILN